MSLPDAVNRMFRDVRGDLPIRGMGQLYCLQSNETPSDTAFSPHSQTSSIEHTHGLTNEFVLLVHRFIDGYGNCFHAPRFRSQGNIRWKLHTVNGISTTRRNTDFPFGSLRRSESRFSAARSTRRSRQYFKYRMLCWLISVEMGDGHLTACVRLVLSDSMRISAQSMNNRLPSSIWAVTRRMAALPWLALV